MRVAIKNPVGFKVVVKIKCGNFSNLSTQLGFSREYMSGLHKGRQTCSAETAKKISSYLGVDFKDLFKIWLNDKEKELIKVLGIDSIDEIITQQDGQA